MFFPKNFSDLPEKEKMLACFLAHTGSELDEISILNQAAKFKMMRGAAMGAIDVLKAQGIIKEKKEFCRASKFSISMDFLCYAFFYMFTEHPEWVNIFGKPKNTTSLQRICVNMEKMVRSILDREKRKSKNKPLEPPFIPTHGVYSQDSVYFFDAFAGILLEPEILPVLTLLPVNVLERLIEDCSIRHLEHGYDRVITLINNLIALQPNFTSQYNHSLGSIAQDIFYATGEWYFDEFKVSKNDYYRIMCDAIRLAYQGKYIDALKTMNASFKVRNTVVEASDKNIFGDYISTYFMVLIYALEDSDASRKKLDMSTRKHLMETTMYAAAATLAHYFKSPERKIHSSILTSGLSYINDCKGAKSLAFHVARYLGLQAKDLEYGRRAPSMDVKDYISNIAIIRHEMSKYMPMDEVEKEHLEQIYGGKPLLTSIHRKEEWEIILEDIYNKETIGGSVDGSESSARGMYIMNRWDENVEVREQGRIKSGAWSKGKRLSFSTYSAGKFQMDDIDRKIHETNRQKGRSSMMPNLTVVIPHLVGTDDRLYYESGSNTFEPVTVIQEKPFIALEKDKSGIRLHTNIPGKVNYKRTVIWNFDEKMMRLTYYPMEPTEHQYIHQLTSLGTLPLEAEPMLQQVFPTLKGKVEIHTDFIEGVEQLAEEDGQTIVCLRVMPHGACFDVTIYVVPLKGGHQSFAPGDGKDVIYDDRDGERFQVKRHKRLEKRNAQVFYDFMEEVLDIYGDEDSGNRGTLELSAEEMIELMDFAYEHTENGYIEWPEGEKLRLKVAQPSTWSVSMKSHGGWFDIEGDVKVDDDTILSIGQLLDMVATSRSRFVQLSEGEYLSITDSLRKQLLKLSSLSSVSRGKTRIPAVGVALMGSAFDGDLEIKHPKAVDDLRKKIKASGRLRPTVPDDLNATLRDYQYDGFQWMARLDSWGAGACLSDDMGLGKTIQAIAFMLYRRDDGANLVVAPASVVPNWRNELKRFAPTLNVVILNEQSDRQKAIEDADSGTVIITTYGLLITQEDSLAEKMWGVICLDEAHTIKNRDTKMSGVCMKLQSSHRIILTGTPLQNHLGELWNLFQFVNPGLLGTYEQFQKKFIIPIEAGDNEECRQMLRRMIKPFMLRRTKQEVATELPDKEEITLHVELSADEMAVYEVIRRRAKEELEELQKSGKKVNMSTLAEITKLRMASCSAQLAQKSWTGPCAKLDTFIDLVTELKQGGHRALVFSQFTSFLEMAKTAIKECKELQNLKYFYLDGSTPMKKREEMVKAFQKGECDIFIISLKAGGLGLNLTGANYVIHLDPWWNPAIEQQATDRAHRIGQTEKVTVYHLISSNTIEEKILRLHEHKRDLATSLLEGTNESHKITTAELLDMING